MTTSNPADRLDSWKEIVAYLRRHIRTVQRWEKKEGLSVYRHSGWRNADYVRRLKA